ncbi:MAG: hypothetical protein GWN58_62835, partial [Anaerolineae bacterium]|nr:hypothetical protein [Anaerolineae bacterium]
MDTEVFVDALAITMIALSLGAFALGIRVSSAKPFLLRSRIYVTVAVLIFVLPMAASFAGAWPPDWGSVLSASLSLTLVLSALLFGMYRTMGDIVVYNTTETMLREVLEEALGEHTL